MYEYKTEILSAGIRWVKGKAGEADATKLDELLNQRGAEGWELVNYVYTTEVFNVHANFCVTFRKAK
jgi:hypothetical protein